MVRSPRRGCRRTASWTLLRLLPLLSLLPAVTCDGPVLTLDAETFEAAVKSHPLLLVNFFAPWCGHCKNLEPEFEKAARHLEGRVTFAQVDATYEVALAEDYKVEGYPTIRLFAEGRHEEYTGSRANASLVQWVLAKSGPAVVTVSSEDALKRHLSSRTGVSSAAFVARGNAQLLALFTAIAEQRRAWGTFVFLADSAENVVEVHRGSREIVELRGAQETSDLEAVLEFLRVEMMPLFGEITEDNYAGYLARADFGIIWVVFPPDNYAGDAERWGGVFREVAVQFPKFPVVYIDAAMYDEHVQEELGCSDPPAVVIQVGNLSSEDEDPSRYKLALREELFSAEAIARWVTDVLAGRVQEEDPLDLPDNVEEPGGDRRPPAGGTSAASASASEASARPRPPPSEPPEATPEPPAAAESAAAPAPARDEL